MKRDSRGRFAGANRDEEFNFSHISAIIIRFFSLVPWIIILFGVYRYFSLDEKTFDILESAVCGKNCTCLCHNVARDFKKGF